MYNVYLYTCMFVHGSLMCENDKEVSTERSRWKWFSKQNLPSSKWRMNSSFFLSYWGLKRQNTLKDWFIRFESIFHLFLSFSSFDSFKSPTHCNLFRLVRFTDSLVFVTSDRLVVCLVSERVNGFKRPGLCNEWPFGIRIRQMTLSYTPLNFTIFSCGLKKLTW